MATRQKWLRAIGFYRGFLLTSFMPYTLGAILAWSATGEVRWGLLVATLLAVLATHAATNLLNEHYDHLSGADVDNPIRTPFSGGTRVIEEGLLTPVQIRRAGYRLMAVAAVLFAILSLRAGWPLALLAAFGMVSGWGYSAGPLRIAYRGLGELLIGLVHGPALTVTGCFVASGQVFPSAWWAGAVAGFYTMAIITINEVPDYDADRGAGKRNLVVRFGRARGLQLWASFLYLSFASLAAAIFLGGLPRQTLLALLVLPRLVRLVDRAPAALDDLPTLVDLCGTTIKTKMLLWVLLVAGVAAARWLGGAA